MDTLVSLESYPTEDTKVKALSTKSAGGGPAGTGIVAAAKLGAECSFIGNLSDDAGGVFLKGDFEKYGVSIYIPAHSQIFGSCVRAAKLVGSIDKGLFAENFRNTMPNSKN
jgi:sugar/nucleoside kinase (ribokinase family)